MELDLLHHPLELVEHDAILDALLIDVVLQLLRLGEKPGDLRSWALPVRRLQSDLSAVCLRLGTRSFAVQRGADLEFLLCLIVIVLGQRLLGRPLLLRLESLEEGI